MNINRITGAAKGRSPAVHHYGIVYAVATAGSNSSSVTVTPMFTALIASTQAQAPLWTPGIASQLLNVPLQRRGTTGQQRGNPTLQLNGAHSAPPASLSKRMTAS